MSRITLKSIETLTYNFTETEMEQAKALRADLDELYSKYHALLAKRQGILLHPNANVAIQYMRRKVQRARFTLRCSTIRRSKPKRLKASSRRVGAKADRLRKEAMVCWAVSSYTVIVTKNFSIRRRSLTKSMYALV